MLIDWFTVGAQTLNFLILVWLMKRFLYQPVLDAIDAREKRIATELADAAQKQTQADEERDTFQQKNVAFDQQREELVRKATAEVDTERQRMLDEARAAAEAMRTKWHATIDRELLTLQQGVAQRSQDEVFAIARKVLTDLAGTSLEDRMTEVFCQRLSQLDAQAKGELAKALKTSSDPVQVRTAFALSPEQQTAMEQALDTAMDSKIPIAFETTPEVISGIELSANGWKVDWNIAGFLASLEHSMGALMDPAKNSATVAL